MKLSIVVPIYNVENYLDQCLSSIQDQTFNDFQVILINDGSTDASLNIAQSYCEKDSRFKVYTKENGGLSSARNYGLKYVLGEYLTFLDSDDYVDTEAYSLMMNKIEKESLDIVMSDIKYFFEDQSQCYVLKGMNQSIEASTSKRALLSPMFAWNKIYRTSYFKEQGVRYPEGLWYEDIPVSSKLFINTSKIGYVESVCYYYRQRTSSIMGQRSSKMADIFIILKTVIEDCKTQSLYETYYDELEYLCIEHIMLYDQFRFLVSDDYQILYQQSVSFMNAYFKDYKKNKYVAYLSSKNRLFINTLNKQTMVLYRKYLKRT